MPTPSYPLCAMRWLRVPSLTSRLKRSICLQYVLCTALSCRYCSPVVNQVSMRTCSAQVMLKKYLHITPLDCVYQVCLAAFYVVSKAARLSFLEYLSELCVLGPPTAAPPGHQRVSSADAKADGSLAQQTGPKKLRRSDTSFGEARLYDKTDPSTWITYDQMREITHDLVENVVVAKIFDPLFQRYLQYGVFDARFPLVCREMVHLLFNALPQRRLGTVILVLCKVCFTVARELNRFARIR